MPGEDGHAIASARLADRLDAVSRAGQIQGREFLRLAFELLEEDEVRRMPRQEAGQMRHPAADRIDVEAGEAHASLVAGGPVRRKRIAASVASNRRDRPSFAVSETGLPSHRLTLIRTHGVESLALSQKPPRRRFLPEMPRPAGCRHN